MIILRYLWIALYYVIVTASPVINDESRIINGKNATEGQFPYMVSLQQYYPDHREHVCSISLITAKTCLGAAHCLYDEDGLVSVEDLCGIVSSLYQSNTSDCHEFAKIIQHEQYDSEFLLNDIALFIFNEEIILDDNTNVIKLAGPMTDIARKSVIALGWGITRQGGLYSHRLQYTFLDVVEQSICEHLFGLELRDTQVCLFKQNTNTCSGDSGGPIISTDSNVEIALSSYGSMQCKANPSVSTDIRRFVDWIKENAEGEPEIEE